MSVYFHILYLIEEEQSTTFDKSNLKLSEKVRDEISRDLKRTLTSEKMKTEEG
jgi:hypothetical protein